LGESKSRNSDLLGAGEILIRGGCGGHVEVSAGAASMS